MKLLRVSEKTAQNAFYELIEHGFIVLTKGEIYVQRKAREWRLTIEPCNEREPTDDWRQWEPGKAVARVYRNNGGQKRGQGYPRNGGRLPQEQGQSENTEQTEFGAPSIIQ